MSVLRPLLKLLFCRITSAKDAIFSAWFVCCLLICRDCFKHYEWILVKYLGRVVLVTRNNWFDVRVIRFLMQQLFYTLFFHHHSVFRCVASSWQSPSICSRPSLSIFCCSFHFQILCWLLVGKTSCEHSTLRQPGGDRLWEHVGTIHIHRHTERGMLHILSVQWQTHWGQTDS